MHCIHKYKLIRIFLLLPFIMLLSGSPGSTISDDLSKNLSKFGYIESGDCAGLRGALMSFQKAYGLKESGMPDRETSDKISEVLSFMKFSCRNSVSAPPVSIKTYSRARDGEKNLSESFKVEQFACSDDSDLIRIDSRLVFLLQMIKDHYNKDITIKCSYKSPEYSIKTDGVENSCYTRGTGADIYIEDVPLKAAEICAENVGASHINTDNGTLHIESCS